MQYHRTIICAIQWFDWLVWNCQAFSPFTEEEFECWQPWHKGDPMFWNYTFFLDLCYYITQRYTYFWWGKYYYNTQFLVYHKYTIISFLFSRLKFTFNWFLSIKWMSQYEHRVQLRYSWECSPWLTEGRQRKTDSKQWNRFINWIIHFSFASVNSFSLWWNSWICLKNI